MDAILDMSVNTTRTSKREGACKLYSTNHIDLSSKPCGPSCCVMISTPDANLKPYAVNIERGQLFVQTDQPWPDAPNGVPDARSASGSSR